MAPVTMTRRMRRVMLIAHLGSSVGLLGAVAAFLLLAVAGLVATDPETVRAAYVAMGLTARFVVVPLAFAALLVGIVESLGTRWGLFRYYWILAKLGLTVIAVVVLLLQMSLIGTMAGAAADQPIGPADFLDARLALVLHSGGGLLVLLVPLALSIFKPPGLTRYGQRQLNARRAETPD